MSILHLSSAATKAAKLTQAAHGLTAGASLVTGTLLRQHARAGGSAEVNAILAEAVTRLWQAIGQGDICLALFDADANLIMNLKRSPIVMVDPVFETLDGRASDIRPLVIANNRLFTYRYWLAERLLAKNLILIATSPFSRLVVASAADDEASLGKAQRQALSLASSRRLLVLTGGPGTGKTHTLAAIVRAAVAAASQRASAAGSTGALSSPFAIAVAAPTGKATARIAGAIASAIDASAIDSSLEGESVAAGEQTPLEQSKVLLEAMTLHRLLGLKSSSTQENMGENLPFDLIVIDESSMVDTLMATRLLSSLRADTQLIFAGDRDQLASVQAGAFFGTLCTTSDERIAACRIELDQNYRQKEAPEILAWADAVRTGQLLNMPSGQQVLFDSGGAAALIRQAVERFMPLIAAATKINDGECVALIKQYMLVQVLASLRTGSEGVEVLNASIGLAIRDGIRNQQGKDIKEALSHGDRWFPGRLVVVRKNAAHRGLFNGDVGLCVSLPDGNERALKVAFEQADGSARYVLPSQMPTHEDAWALTVHQAQGSDFDQVLFLPAPAGHALATREGIYTAITRARKQITIFGTSEDITAAANRPGLRESGLMDALSSSETPP